MQQSVNYGIDKINKLIIDLMNNKYLRIKRHLAVKIPMIMLVCDGKVYDKVLKDNCHLAVKISMVMLICDRVLI